MKNSVYALAGGVSAALAATHGFNYASQSQTESSFETQFNTAQGLETTSGWNSARLYTMIQDGTTNTVISAIPAAIATKTTLLLGLWASEDQATFDNELTALKDAISQYGSDLASLVVGISVGSEDLYRTSPTGILSDAGTGQSPDVLVDYIGQVRSAIAGTALSGASIGHVDTWNSWTNTSNAAVISAVDWLGMDTYPYYQSTYENDISNAANLFFEAYNATLGVSDGKDVWVTESGWPVSGPTENEAVASVANAETYWKAVACPLLERDIPTWWYILTDSGASPSFGVTDGTSETPLYDLSCPSVSSASSSSSASSTSSVASATKPTTAATSTTLAVSEAVPSASFASGSSAASAASAASTVVSSAASAVSSAISTATSAVASAVTSTMTDDEVVTSTLYSTTLITVTSCDAATVTACPTSSAASAESSVLATAASSVTSAAGSSVTPSGTATSSGCPADISGAYQYPHLIVPVSSSSPSTAFGTQYNGTVSPTVSTIFNFDIPESYANKTCSTVFLFPELDQLETSSYSFNNQGGFTISILSGVATESTTYSNAPAVEAQIGAVSSLERGNSYTLSHDSCPAGTTVSFELTSTGGLDLEFFEDYNPSPLGLYVRAC